MPQILKFLRNIWILDFFLRIYQASKYYNKRYCQILKWGIKSNENTNFTYHLSAANTLYLANTLSVVTGVEHSKVMGYFKEIENDQYLKKTISSAIKNSGFAKFADQEVRFGRRIGWYAIARIIKPEVIIETGVDKGLGSVLLCAALLKNKEEGNAGRYFGTDINPEAGYFLTDKYKEVGEILYGDSIGSLKEFKGNIDLFINDSDHSSEYEYREYLTIKNQLSDKSIILGDNSHCSDKLAIFSNETDRNFLFFKEEPLNHWYPGAGIGISYKKGRI